MIKVTYSTSYKVKEGRKWITKNSQIIEIHKSESDARLRGMALNWAISKIEVA